MDKVADVIRAIFILIIAEAILLCTQIVASIVYQNILIMKLTGQGIREKSEILDRLTKQFSSQHFLVAVSIVSLFMVSIIYVIHYRIHYYEKQKEQTVNYKDPNHYFASILLISGVLLALCSYCLCTYHDIDLFRKGIISIQNLSFAVGLPAVVSEMLILPIAEETLFRGVILKRLRKSVSPICAIVVQAILCGIFQMNVRKGIYAVLLSIVLGSLMIKKDSLLYCIRIRIYLFAITFIIWRWLYVWIPMNRMGNAVIIILSVVMLIAGECLTLFYEKYRNSGEA